MLQIQGKYSYIWCVLNIKQQISQHEITFTEVLFGDWLDGDARLCS